ncbi:MAG TPA: 3-deoxy-7-phosphoheptulonate synthase, partial [Candidatus Goldiibacteriota bacterium]|nr:3-deoxy-7-phosphoheptulonate synthase [Candidatus Goldiibacteriota bacterium]
MIIVMKPKSTNKQIEHIVGKIKEYKLTPHISKGKERTIIGVIGDERVLQNVPIEGLPGVEKVMQVLKPYKLASREFKKTDTIVDVSGVKVGGKKVVVIAGPCSVESERQLFTTAKAVKNAGADMLRGGAFKPRTSPYAFQGM